MKFIMMNDWHFRATAPIGRKDDYVETQFRKLDQMIDYANEINAPILAGGDIFDAATAPTWLVNRLILHLRRCKTSVNVIAGNHDLPWHTYDRIRGSSICTLHEAGCLTLCENEGILFSKRAFVNLTSFGLPPREAPTGDWFKILVVHEPVFDTAVPFYMSDALTIDQLEKKYPGYDLILAGDIHIPAIRSKTVVTGSMMRSTRAQKDFRPGFVEVDTETNERTVHYFDIEEDVWKDVVEISSDSAFSTELQEFSATLAARGDRIDFKQAIRRMAEETRPELKQRFEEILSTYINKETS